jgi:hypothetical protein
MFVIDFFFKSPRRLEAEFPGGTSVVLDSE